MSPLGPFDLIERVGGMGEVWRALHRAQGDAVAEKASGGQFVAGSPFLAMELATGGTLAPATRPDGEVLEWPELRAVLLDLLDALGQAAEAAELRSLLAELGA